MRRLPALHVRPALALAALLVLSGCFGLGTGTGTETGTGTGSGGLAIEERWTAGTSEIEGNHHAVAAGTVDGGAVVAIPIGGHSGEHGCMLLVVDGDGEERWTSDIPPDACTIHAVADPAIADWVGDDRPELLAATTEEQVVAHDAETGEAVFRMELSDYGYTQPIVADVTGDGDGELVVTDVRGTVYVVRPDGSTVWTRSLDAYSWSAPAIHDFDGDDDVELAVGLGNGTALAFTHEGDLAWRQSVEGKITWTTDGDLDDDGAREFVVATSAGTVTALDGTDGSVEWTREFEGYAAVEAVADPDGDGTASVYATARDGGLRALDGATGETEWTVSLTDEAVQMMPPPVVGDVTGDGDRELVAVTHTGRTVVVTPGGEVLATHERDGSVYTHATVTDTDGDGAGEIYVVYGDGTAVALEGQTSSSSS